MTTRRTRLPLATARRVARDAVRAVRGDLWVLLGASEALEPQFTWICVSLRTPPGAHASSHTHLRFEMARAIREGLGVLTLLAACDGFGLRENGAFWSEVLPERPPQAAVSSWARANWSERCTRPRPSAELKRPRFRFVVDDRGAAAAATSATSAVFMLSVLEMLVSMDELEHQPQTPAFEVASTALRPWVRRERLAQTIECGVEVQDQHADRACRLLRMSTTRGCGAVGEAVLVPPPLRVQKIFYSMPFADRSQQALESLTQLVVKCADVQLEEMHLRIVEKRQQKPDVQTLAALQSLLWEACQEGRRTLTEAARWKFELHHPSAIAAVCSAFSSMTEAHQVHLVFPKTCSANNDERLESARAWKWLAVALFHPSTASRAQALALENCRLTMDDVAAIEEVLASDWGETMMQLEASRQNLPPLPISARDASSSSFSATERTKVLFADVTQGTRVEFKPVRRLFGSPLATLARQGRFPVLHANSDWVCIQLPGYGCGFVARTSVLSVEDRDFDQRGLTTLSIDVDDADAAVGLLRLVGGSLQNLALKSNTFRRSHLAKLVECCPCLTSLRLSSIKLDDFSDAIEASVRGQWFVTSLEVNTPTISGACIQQLCSTMSSPDRCPLRELRLGTGRLTSRDLETMLRMLDVNRTLKFLHVRVSFGLFGSFFPRFRAHRGDRIQDAAESKRVVAFLASIGYFSASESPMKNADSAIMASILSFAGAGTRAISVEENTDGMSLEQIAARAARA